LIRRVLRVIDALWKFGWDLRAGLPFEAIDRLVDRISPPARKQ